MKPKILLFLAVCVFFLMPGCGDDDDSSSGNPDAGFDAGADTDTDTDTDADTDSDSDADSDTDTGELPECPDAVFDSLQKVTDTVNSPYFVHHPSEPSEDTPTVLFLPGGPGSLSTAQGTYDGWLSNGDGLDEFRVIVPYATDGNFQDEKERAIEILDEVLECWGGDPGRVHLGGTSLGGISAYDLMLDHSERFATLLGAPGVFSNFHEDEVSAAFEGKSVFNGVGELDSSWHDAVEQQNEDMVALGIDAVFVEFAGQGHIVTSAFNETMFFDFWSAH